MVAKKAVIFDLDGTLADTLDDLTDAYNYGLKELGLEGHVREEYRRMVGTGSLDLCRKALPPERGDLAEKLLEISLKRYREHYLDKTAAYPGIMEMLEELAGRGIRLAVLSNKPEAFTKRIALEMFGAQRFEVLMGQRDGVALKPDPAGVLVILKEMGLAAGEAVYVGDSGTDMATAVAAGVQAVGVSWGFRDADELRAAGADKIIDRPSELLHLLEE